MRARTTRSTLSSFVAAAACVAASAAIPTAQGRPKADVSVVLAADGVHPGTTERAALRVSLPDGIHVQSDQPRDPFLIATSVTATPPAGIRLGDVVYPAASEFKQNGGATTLQVFEQRFVIGLEVLVDRTVGAGDVTVPLRLRYQACDDRTCFAPLREDIPLVLHVVPAGTKVAPRFTELFDGLTFRR